MPNYRSGVDGLRLTTLPKGGITFVASTTPKNGIHILTVVLGWMRLVIHICPLCGCYSPDELRGTNLLFLPLSSKKNPYGKSKAKKLSWMKSRLFSYLRRLLYSQQGSQAEPKIQFKSNQESFRSTCQIRHKSWKCTIGGRT